MRIKAIDILRAFAILGVLFRHSVISAWYARAGWAGVDLFFVLSGFLVSGLLFNEYKKTDHVRVGRFLIRRGFKIYPSFYVFLLVALLTETFWYNTHYPLPNVLSEAFFLQSYFDGCFIHTWSLAIEEHFYILVSLFILLAVYKKWIPNRKLMISSLLAAIILVFTMRFQYVFARINEPSIHFFKTHLRMDGLLIGVLISYMYHFSERFKAIFSKNLYPFAAAVIALISLPFIFPAGSFFMLTAGLTLMQAGFGILVALVVVFSETLNGYRWYNSFFISALTMIGRYSYSIYLWHLFLYKGLLTLWHDEPPVIIYFIVTIVGGICLSLIIEQVFLKIRDKYFSPVVVGIK